VPVLVMMDECVGHMTEKVVIPPAEQIEVYPRRYTALPPAEYQAFRPEADLVPQFARAGEGYHFHVTGLTHDEHGYPAMNVEPQRKLVTRLMDKIRCNADALARNEEYRLEDADVVVIAYGITARVAMRAVQMAREQGVRAGLLRPLVVWPFPQKRLRELATRNNFTGFVVAELNCGQVFYEVERLIAGCAPVLLEGHTGGTVHKPEQILDAILRCATVGAQHAAPAVEVSR
jgi:2-oxoglutarate ferredoxin oxidoreductase subunit alpha